MVTLGSHTNSLTHSLRLPTLKTVSKAQTIVKEGKPAWMNHAAQQQRQPRPSGTIPSRSSTTSDGIYGDTLHEREGRSHVPKNDIKK
ncbi:hypothetical protein CF328_g1770 [Tilletia controversa]|nr:hypothetical protein CF328_g1770 [Tilletia controversa]